MTTFSEAIINLECNQKHVYLYTSKTLIDLSKQILNTNENIVIPLDSELFCKLLPINGAVNLLFELGFEEKDDCLHFPEKNIALLRKTLNNLLEHRKQFFEKFIVDSYNNYLTTVSHLPITNLNSTNEFLKKINNYFNNILRYKNLTLLKKARSLIPLETLLDSCVENIEINFTNTDDNISLDELLIYELMKWFKNAFFKWVNAPECDNCGNETSTFKNNTLVDSIRVEIYECNKCSIPIRFHRHNDLDILLETRRGRCGEWANVFTLFCYSLGFDARFVSDITDHVWTEVFLKSQNRWIHCDACETALDSPLIYESGWNKKLTYVIAYSLYEVQDVTWRYSIDHKATYSRRHLCNETELITTMIYLREQRQKHFSHAQKLYFETRLISELAELMIQRKPNDKEQNERVSGSIAWRVSRGEATKNKSLEYKFIWKPKNNTNYFHLKYNCAVDKYLLLNDEQNILETLGNWDKGTYKIESMFRKVEHDWKFSYLARCENTNLGKIIWRFEAMDYNCIDIIKLKFQMSVFENGQITLQLTSLDNSINLTLQDKNSSEFIIKDFSNSNGFYLMAILEKGCGDNAWQHAQLFRQNLKDSDKFPFDIQIIFKKKNN